MECAGTTHDRVMDRAGAAQGNSAAVVGCIEVMQERRDDDTFLVS